MDFFGARWLWALSAIHLAGCMAIWLARVESGVHYLIYADFPMSLLIVMLGWRNDSFLLLFATIGTAWWYGLSYFARRLFTSVSQ